MAKSFRALNALTFARVLVDIPVLAATPKHIVQGTAAHIDALSRAGLVDAHPDAVAYAQATGAEVVQTTDAVLALAQAADAAAAEAAEAAEAAKAAEAAEAAEAAKAVEAAEAAKAAKAAEASSTDGGPAPSGDGSVASGTGADGAQ